MTRLAENEGERVFWSKREGEKRGARKRKGERERKREMAVLCGVSVRNVSEDNESLQ